MANASIITRDLEELAKDADNVYEAINIISKRAKQISITTKEELSAKLTEFASSIDNLEEIFENREQIEISKFYERMPKPTAVAIEEYKNGNVMYRYKDEEA